ncbi:fungal-specific transcription factor domain-containing protein [Aspergillus pseudoustus]|uniref:Fungal-specific transcription factor domain-containing protein n=1 Tax=Aspergillus pseudoustus TaxID=1810923 RepID=A0ABR4K0N9_9EURO
MSKHPARGMDQTPGVFTTFPLDNILREVHRLLGPTWQLPPYSLPPYLSPPSPHLQEDDLDFLLRRGGLDTVEPELAQEIFKAYICHIHPFIPFLDLELFSDSIFGATSHHEGGGPENSRKISLLLFHAVMFAGAMFVDLKYLYAAGYVSRSSAVDVLFQRARVLYELNGEEDPFSVIQSLLLMTYRCENPEQHKDAQHWISVCVSLACKAGLQLDDRQDSNNIWKVDRILWWCIFTRDRLIALGLQRPPFIKDEMHISVPVLQCHDFQILKPGPTTSYAVSCYGNHKTSLERMFIEKTKLCRCIKDGAFSWPNYQAHIVASTAVQPRQVALFLSELELSHWLHDLPESIAFSQKPFLPTTDADLILYFHTAWLRLIYLKIFSTLNQQLLSLDTQECPVLSSATEAASILNGIYQKNSAFHFSTVKEGQLPLWLSAWMVPWPCRNCQMGQQLEFSNPSAGLA